MEPFRVKAENNNYFVGGILVMALGIVGIIIVIAAVIMQGHLDVTSIVGIAVMVVLYIWAASFGYRMVNDAKKKYTIFDSEKMEVHDYDEIKHYDNSQVKEIKELVVNGGRGHRIVYLFTMEDGYRFHVQKDSRVSELFADYKIEKKHSMNIYK